MKFLNRAEDWSQGEGALIAQKSNGNAIAAYNAALMRLERGAEGDRAAALALLERGEALGDAKSRTRLDAGRARD